MMKLSIISFLFFRLSIQNLSYEQICLSKAIRESRQTICQSHRSSSAKKITCNNNFWSHTSFLCHNWQNTFRGWYFKKLNLYRVIVIINLAKYFWLGHNVWKIIWNVSFYNFLKTKINILKHFSFWFFWIIFSNKNYLNFNCKN